AAAWGDCARSQGSAGPPQVSLTPAGAGWAQPGPWGRSVHQPLRPDIAQDRDRDLLDRFVRRAEPRDALAAHHRLGLAHLFAAAVERGVAAARAALVADLRQPVGVDRQAEALGAVRLQRARQ